MILRIGFYLLLLSLTPTLLWGANTQEMHSVANELDVLPAKLETKTLQVSPRLLAVTRDRLIHSLVLAEIGVAQLKAQTTFNALTQELSYRLWYGYRTNPLMFGFSVLDRVEFEKEVLNQKFIGRERHGSFELMAPLKGRLSWVLNLSGGEYTTLTTTKPKIFQHEQAFSHEWTLGIFPVYQGGRLSFKQGVKFLSGDFQYQTVETEWGWRIPDSSRRWIFRAHATAGTPIRGRGSYPLYEGYFLGGYETLPGWRLYELAGDSAVFGFAGLRLPLKIEKVSHKRNVWISEISCLSHFYFAAVGDEGVFKDRSYYRTSFLIGPRIALTIKGGTVVSLQGEWCHPIHTGRPDVFYLSLGVS